jgi:prefoldin subunit 5
VLELKSSEMQDLRKQNERLQREVEDLPAIVQRLEAAQSRVEDLNVQLQRKSEIEMYGCFLLVL